MHICMGGPDVKMRTIRGTVKFEEHPYFGPVMHKVLGERHPFWALRERWVAAGKHIDAAGFAVFEVPSAPRGQGVGKEPSSDCLAVETPGDPQEKGPTR